MNMKEKSMKTISLVVSVSNLNPIKENLEVFGLTGKGMELVSEFAILFLISSNQLCGLKNLKLMKS